MHSSQFITYNFLSFLHPGINRRPVNKKGPRLSHYSIFFTIAILCTTLNINGQSNYIRNYTNKDVVTDILIHEDRVFVTTTGGIAIIPKDDYQNYEYEKSTAYYLNNNNIIKVLADNSDNPYFLSNPESDPVSIYYIDKYTLKPKVEEEYISDFAIDASDTMWFTGNGLHSMVIDDNQINLNLECGLTSNDTAYYIDIDTDNNKWVATNKGILRYKNQTDYEYFSFSDVGLPGNVIFTDIEVDSYNNIWVGTNIGAFCKWGIGWTNLFDPVPVTHINRITANPDGSVWIASEDKGLVRFNINSYSLMNAAEDFPSNSITVAKTFKDTTWIATKDQGLLMRTSSNENTQVQLNTVSTHAELFNDIAVDKTGDKWFATGDGGVIQYDIKEEYYKQPEWIQYNTDNSDIPCDNILSIAADANDKIWIGSADSGLIVFDQTNCEIFSKNNTPNLPGNTINCIHITEDNTKWIGTNKGLLRISNETWTTFNRDNTEFPSNNVLSIYDLNDTLWVGTEEGIAYYQNGNMMNLFDEPFTAGSPITCITSDINGKLLVGVEGKGVARLDNGKFNLFGNASDYSSLNITDIVVDKYNEIWISSTHGLDHFSGIDGTFVSTTNEDNSKITDDYINTLHVTEFNTIWTCTNKGYATVNYCHPIGNTTLTGPDTICNRSFDVLFSTEEVPYAVNYTWQLTDGFSFTEYSTESEASINVLNYNVSSGIVYVGAVNTCGQVGAIDSISFQVLYEPETPELTGPESVCKNQTELYSITPIDNADSYIWSFPDETIDTTPNTEVSIDFSSGNNFGTISVKSLNICASSAESSLFIEERKSPGTITEIQGNNAICFGSTYSYKALTNDHFDEFIWIIPDGSSITTNTSNTSIDFSDITTIGTLAVKGQNKCGISDEATLTIGPKPVGSINGIDGLKTVCEDSDADYSLPNADTFNIFIWELPDGSALASDETINIDFSGMSGSTLIKVKGENGCGISNEDSITVNIEPIYTPNLVRKGNNGSLLICTDSGMVYEWYKDEEIISGETNQFLDLARVGAGSYHVILSNLTCAANSSTINISSIGNNLSVAVAPNPINGNLLNFSVETPGEETLNYRLINSQGVTVHSGIVAPVVFKAQHSIPIDLPTGTYTLFIDNGKNQSCNQLIIVQ